MCVFGGEAAAGAAAGREAGFGEGARVLRLLGNSQDQLNQRAKENCLSKYQTKKQTHKQIEWGYSSVLNPV